MIRRKHVQVEHVERPIDNCVQVFISPLVAAKVHSNYISQQPQLLCISVRYASRKFLSHYTLHNFPFVPNISHAITSGDTRLVKRGNMDGQLLQSRTTLRGAYCETRSEPQPSLVPGCRIVTMQEQNECILFALLDVRNAISSCLRFCCTNNRIIFTCTNELEYENQHIFPEKGGV